MVNLRKGLVELIEKTNENELIIGLVKLTDEWEAERIYHTADWYNYYLGVENYSDLKQRILEDETLWEDCELEEDKFYQVLDNEDNETILKDFLNKNGWIIASNGLAICLDEKYFICNDSALFSDRAEELIKKEIKSYELSEIDVISVFSDFLENNPEISVNDFSKEELINIMLSGRKNLEHMEWSEYLSAGFELEIDRIKKSKSS